MWVGRSSLDFCLRRGGDLRYLPDIRLLDDDARCCGSDEDESDE